MTTSIEGFSVGDEVVFVSFEQDPTFWPRIDRPHVVVKLDPATHTIGVGMAGVRIDHNTVMYVPPEDLMLWSIYRATMELAVGKPPDEQYDHVADALGYAMEHTKSMMMHKILTGKRR